MKSLNPVALPSEAIDGVAEAMSNDRKDDEMICALTADEYVALQRGLEELPQTMPPRHVWQKIREQAEAEGLFARPSARGQRKWYAGIGVAAAALMAAVIMTGNQGPGIVVPTEPVTNNDVSDLTFLQAQSRQLEREIRSLPAEPKVARASTVATLTEIEERIAAIDYQLNDPTAEWVDGEKEIFWRERVRLMNLLLQLRYAQAQRAAY